MASDATKVATEFLDAFGRGDVETMRNLLADDVVAYITNRAGGADRVDGRDGYLARVDAMDLPAAQFSLALTQDPVTIGSELVLMMVEVRASRSGRTLLNFAAIVVRVVDSVITEWWMADAKPAESDRFWLGED
ncbi:nuclear transport factor 2 family protein [Smaragdicoccus niigatensis]|uniref:nuclear transport factor 2 family protein n=1 Tax=Smaragdicoccus niigatensis TaxID=359359 RepID=UPI00037F3A2D|nr:nuclear transport factor 2 family protein [Smaragdicoccus niigatensis]